MITWMQRHKKWLVITIWISTIAFVGAGFVGWGSYNYGSKGGVVAVVGDREVSVEEYQREYSSLYDQYSRVFGQQFNQEMADKLKLKEVAYNTAIQKNLILSFADEISLGVTDDEVAKELVKIPGFIKDGKFDKDTYIKVLHQNRTTPIVFEASLKRDILLQKVEKIFKVDAQKSEIEALNRLFFSKDNINIEILSQKDIDLKYSDEDLKKYWEINKNNYKSETSFELQIDEIPLVSNSFSDEEIEDHYNKFKTEFIKEDGKIKSLEEAKDDIIKSLNEKETKKVALKKYLQLKKGELKFVSTENIKQSELAFPEENNQEVINSVPGDVLKPFFNNDKFVIVKVLNKILPKTLEYEEAKALVKVDYEKITKGLELEKLADKRLKVFEGTNIGYVSRDSLNSITGLNPDDSLTFLNRLFSSAEKSGKITIGDKIVLYKITDQTLGSFDEAKNEVVKGSVNTLINQELMNNLVKNLQNRYEVQSSITFEE
ncbi:peptidylprolyl isomerase [Halarcobacter ebronensis]|uniref:Peptidylprolyl isomerase n=1 Tax=Halarcobacter ebronensis TaxID=1462615 RepID=A0A4Q0YLP5_9BACT|nr:peptidylprolyl isomerase [Halarcobacter ebronensis]RXJ70031.1 peptidylprolyl isomerase [Halarcobacter ebronensis]